MDEVKKIAYEAMCDIRGELWPGLPTDYTDGDLDYITKRIREAIRSYGAKQREEGYREGLEKGKHED